MHKRRLFAYLCEFYRSIVLQWPCVRCVCVCSRFHVYFYVYVCFLIYRDLDGILSANAMQIVFTTYLQSKIPISAQINTDNIIPLDYFCDYSITFQTFLIVIEPHAMNMHSLFAINSNRVLIPMNEQFRFSNYMNEFTNYTNELEILNNKHTSMLL